jgi:hypothetical protein
VVKLAALSVLCWAVSIFSQREADRLGDAGVSFIAKRGWRIVTRTE